RLDLEWVDQSGSEEKGQGMLLGFTLGDPIQKTEEVEVKGFVGFGCNVYDSSTATYWNAKAAKADKIYFHYATDGDVPFISLEVSDSMEVADFKNSTRVDHRGDGVLWFRNFPATGGKWVAVEFPLDSLKIHDDWKGAKNVPLIKTALAKFQWKVQGAKGVSGTFAVDNIYFPGWDNGAPQPAVMYKNNIAQRAAFNATLLNGNIQVTVAKALINGSISLFSSNGTRIASQPVAFKSTFAAKSLPAGMYIVKVNAFDVNGKAVSMQSPVTLVK
ncbi:MAG TPA: T9SS type A sorting domain-containing protein, partial [Chitinispirillaceae bacterium]|nr:T9SS type A sorting domain-containing protein [Chitinispirillaceae bacterium]